MNGVGSGSTAAGTQTLIQSPQDINDISIVRMRVGKSGPHAPDTIGKFKGVKHYSITRNVRWGG